MPDDVKISEMSEAASLDNSAQFPYVQSMNGNLTTLKAPLTQIGTKINESMTFSNLQTTSKTIVGAINEAAQIGGVEYATELPISSTDPTNTKSYIDTKTTLVKSASGSLIHITDGADNIPVKSLVSQIVAVQSGSGTPSPSNPRAISGFDSGIITRCGKNLLPETYVRRSGYTKPTATINNGVITFTDYDVGGRLVGYNVKTNIGTQYTIKFASGTSIAQVGYIESDTEPTAWLGFGTPLTADTPKTITATKEWLQIYIEISANNATLNYLQVEVGDTATTYEAYNGNTYTFTFGQTVYGGHFDNKGNLVVTHKIVDFADLGYYYSNGLFSSTDIPDVKNFLIWNSALKLCSCYEIAEVQTWTQGDFIIGLYGKNIYVKDSRYTDTVSFKQALTGQKFVVELATPITLAITSQDIPTISGVNNIFSNCGDTDIEYFTSSADEVANLVRAEGTYFHKYSTSEHVVGVWIDNKTLYEKTVVIEGSNLTAGQSNIIAHGISNIDFIQITEGSFIFGNGTVKMPLPFADEYKPITNSLVVIEGITDTAIKIGVGSNYINNASPVRAWITLQYTKTT